MDLAAPAGGRECSFQPLSALSVCMIIDSDAENCSYSPFLLKHFQLFLIGHDVDKAKPGRKTGDGFSPIAKGDAEGIKSLVWKELHVEPHYGQN